MFLNSFHFALPNLPFACFSRPFKASRIWTNDTFRVGSSCNALLPLSPPPDGVNLLFETRNFPLFLERYKLTDQLYRVMMRQGVEPFVSMISLKNNEQKAEFYWGLTFLGKTSAFVAGILASVSSLQEIGVKNWILPTGEKVSNLFNYLFFFTNS